METSRAESVSVHPLLCFVSKYEISADCAESPPPSPPFRVYPLQMQPDSTGCHLGTRGACVSRTVKGFRPAWNMVFLRRESLLVAICAAFIANFSVFAHCVVLTRHLGRWRREEGRNSSVDRWSLLPICRLSTTTLRRLVSRQPELVHLAFYISG